VTATVESMVSVTYVRDIDASRAFYQLLGFREQSSGSGATSGWLVVEHNGHVLLLAYTQPPLGVPRLPLLFYFFVSDLDATLATMEGSGVTVAHVGHPPHALGGEAKLLDPDGNTVLLGQRTRSASQPATHEPDASPHFSLLREAAALVEAGGGTKATCQIADASATSCRKKADVKLTDSWGDTAWACIQHADEVLLMVPDAFIARHSDDGLAQYVSLRRR
jgi:catechol 2,3-dioxygenase-like lactoylglutathione lyase family enzyme